MLTQLCYASSRVEYNNDLLQDLSDILATARAFNQVHDIYGVLYYAEGIYFQCLQGEQSQLEQLFTQISKDARHNQIHRFPDHAIEEIHFKQWSMKYVNQHGKITTLFKKMGLDKFLPHQLNDQQINQFLDLLLRMEESGHATKAKVGIKNRGYQNYF
ncbi:MULTISPECIES: BLUF domain-containing protein [unclassified Acinetobacter]|uniref:BLUF domain-containing protein n=1 Tax=unclassified Acinetobacter TaxID=196816 RepID=UPI001202194E|nr:MULTISPECIES: BLUF domain-containing protein [unclassified Acinetobacter]RZJ20967.1 MAG: BLUF domain-containing protein [Acinetobacter sp.]